MLRRILCLGIAGLLQGCAGLHHINTDPATPVEKTALIRPATAEEKVKRPALFPGPSLGLVGITDLNVPKNERKYVKAEGSYRVLPGQYLVRASCLSYPALLFFNVSISVEPGYEYAMECTGTGTRNIAVATRARRAATAATPPPD